jgi:hypothetical protein
MSNPSFKTLGLGSFVIKMNGIKITREISKFLNKSCGYGKFFSVAIASFNKGPPVNLSIGIIINEVHFGIVFFYSK